MEKWLASWKTERSKLAFRGGTYSLIVTAAVLAILVVVNILFSALPSSAVKYDISAAKLYSITSNTKAVVNGLEEDVIIYWIVQSGKEDAVIENLLDKYDSLSDHIQVVRKNPDIYHTFAEQYTDETVQNNSLVVECGDRSRYISYDDIYVQESSVYSYSYSTSFDGEGAITSTIDYVVSEDQPQLYVLEGHGEAKLPETFREQIERDNIEINTFSLLTVDAVPEKADCVMIYAPESDISEEETALLTDYVTSGGKLMVVAGPTETDVELDNLYSLLSDYGVETTEGIVVEDDRNSYAFQAPYMLLPTMASSEITDSLIDENYYPIIPVAQGLTVSGSATNGTVTKLLTTSDGSFSKIDGFDISTYEKEDGDIDGPFSVAVSIEDNSGGQIVWFASSYFLEDMYNAYSSGANVDLAMNALVPLIGEREAMAIRSKSLNYLTISESARTWLKVAMIGVIPLIYLGVGVGIVVKRRRQKHETV